MGTIIKSQDIESNDFNLNIPKVLLNYLGKYDYTIDDLIVLFCLRTNRKNHIISYLAGRSELQKIILFRKYERKLLIKQLVSSDNFDVDNYEIIDNGLELLSNCKNYFSSVEEILDVLNTPISNGEFEKLITSFLEIFPEGGRNKAREILRSNVIDVKKKMKLFISKYHYEPEVILGATKNYISNQSYSNYDYCSGAHYFILKDGVSKLANECENFIQNGNKEDELGAFTEQLM